MNENFDEVFSQMINDLDLKAFDAKVSAEAKAPKDGLAYAGDIEGANGHAYSLYALTLNGKHVFNAVIDNFVEVPVPAEMGTVPAGVTAHTIVIVKPGQVSGITTNGLAFRTPHPDGTHIDGRSVQSYVIPRILRLMIDLYVA